jgi:hypothetical protein
MLMLPRAADEVLGCNTSFCFPQDQLRRVAFFFGWFVSKGFKALRFFGGALDFAGLLGSTSKVAPDKGKNTFLAWAISSSVASGNLLTHSISCFTNQANAHAAHFFLASSFSNSLQVSPLNSISFWSSCMCPLVSPSGFLMNVYLTLPKLSEV